MDLADVGMIETGDGSGFQFKPRAMLLVQSLDGDDPIEPGVASLPYLAHATGADRRKDLVGSEFVANRERHKRVIS